MARRVSRLLFAFFAVCGALPLSADEPVALRIDSLLVTPAHTPSAVVHVKNLTASVYEGTVRLKVPAGWSLKTDEQVVSLARGETARRSFMIQRGTTVEENSYPLEAVATGGGATVRRKQSIVAAAAPYFKPNIDGDPGDWADAIGVSWNTIGKTTTVGTYWNRKQFAMLIAVEEDRLVPATSPVDDAFDAVQLAISPQDARTGKTADDETSRYEFLLVPSGATAGRCYLLATPGMRCGETQSTRSLESLVCADAEIAVRREKTTTYYECAIPWKLMRDDIRCGEGREFCLSLLVHDPDGVGIRDWGEAAGLWPCQRNRLAWSRWPGARWADQPPFDNKTPWGMCSSKY